MPRKMPYRNVSNEKLSPAIARTDLRTLASRSRTRSGPGHHPGARSNRRVASRATTEGDSRCHLKLRRRNRRLHSRPRSGSRSSRSGTPARRSSPSKRDPKQEMKRGDVYCAELVPRSGSQQTGRRPVIVISHDGFNETPGLEVRHRGSGHDICRTVETRAVSCGTAARFRRPGGPEFRRLPSDNHPLTKRLGSPPPSSLEAVENGLRAAMDLLD